MASNTKATGICRETRGSVWHISAIQHSLQSTHDLAAYLRVSEGPVCTAARTSTRKSGSPTLIGLTERLWSSQEETLHRGCTHDLLRPVARVHPSPVHETLRTIHYGRAHGVSFS